MLSARDNYLVNLLSTVIVSSSLLSLSVECVAFGGLEKDMTQSPVSTAFIRRKDHGKRRSLLQEQHGN